MERALKYAQADAAADRIDWLVLFRRGDDPAELPQWFRPWRRWLCQPGYGHVSALMFDPRGNAWVMLDPKWGWVTTRVIPATVPLADILAEVPDLTEAVDVRTCRGGGRRVMRWPFTCVSVVAALLGIEGRPVTPWQLRQYLMSKTARV
jgi:hypothetical protein